MINGWTHNRRHSTPLKAADFNGGEATVKKWLEHLGFDVYAREPTRSNNAVTETTLGAWVMKCNPAVWDLAAFIAAGETIIDGLSGAECVQVPLHVSGRRVHP